MGIKLEQVREEEKKLLEKKRAQCNPEDGFENPINLFGIALSGGGVRSATINLGVLEIFNKCGILKLADYLSTVSGGGYIGGHVHAALKKYGSDKKSFDKLFLQTTLDHFMHNSSYLTPGQNSKKKFFAWCRFLGVIFYSLIMNFIWIIALFGTLYFGIRVLAIDLPVYISQDLGMSTLLDAFTNRTISIILAASLLTLVCHFFLHTLERTRIWSSYYLYCAEGIIFFLFVLLGLLQITSVPKEMYGLLPWHLLVICVAALVGVGIIANPNIITMHSFYKDSLADTFLKLCNEPIGKVRLCDLFVNNETMEWGAAPYPLINGCLNLLGDGKDAYKGLRASDYYLFSPLYCGSKLTGYVQTSSELYRNMDLKTAVAISGAAVNPNMGWRTNRILAFFMTLLNLRMGYWASNPKPGTSASGLKSITWWPYYHVAELLAKANLKREKISVTDGGHIENLGVYELLRRKCKLIIAIDASADPDYSFSDLRNLVVRARQELGFEITFRQAPETYIKPKASAGFSNSHFVVADISELPGKKKDDEEEYAGLLVYVKSSLRPQKEFHKMAENRELKDSFHYKSFHPAFPHEPTSDQFFTEDQWEAYYNLGKYIAADLLKINLREEQAVTRQPINSIDDLCNMFNNIMDGPALMNHYIC